MKKLVALVLILMLVSSSVVYASEQQDLQSYLLGEFQIEVPADWVYWYESEGPMFFFAPSVDDELTTIAVTMYPHSTEAVTAEDDLYSLVNMLYGEMAPSTGIPVAFSDENGFLMGSFEILTSSGDEVITHGMVCNSDSAIMLILYFNTLVSDDQEKSEFDDLRKSVCLVGEDYFDYSIDTLYNKSLNDLVELQRMITIAMWNTNDWQEVEVPQGVYEIGVDIPAGHWTIKAADGAFIGIFYGDKLNDSGKSVSFSSSSFATTTIKSTKSSSFDKNTDQAVYDLDVKDGYFIQIENGTAVFSPYTGKPALGFK